MFTKGATKLQSCVLGAFASLWDVNSLQDLMQQCARDVSMREAHPDGNFQVI